MNHKNFCKHEEFRFAYYFTSAGILKPVYNLVFYCTKCRKVFIDKLKNYEK